MNDLLNEDEFLTKPYNPWKRFCIYYSVAFLLNLISIASIRFLKPKDALLVFLIIIIFFVVPPSLSGLMMLRKPEVAMLPLKLNITSIAILFLCCYMGILSIVLYNNLNFLANIEAFWKFPLILLGIYFVVFAITATLIRYRLKWKQKYKNSRTTTTLPQ